MTGGTLLNRTVNTAAAMAVAAVFGAAAGATAQELPGTVPLTGTNDLPDAYLSGLDRYMLRETERLSHERHRHWNRDFSAGPQGYAASVEPNRQRLARMLGVRDARVSFDAPEPVATLARSAVLGETGTHTLMAIRWPVVGGFWAEGLLLEPKEKPVRRNIVHIPHAGVTPEQMLGVTPGGPSAAAGFAAPAPGCRMVLPAVVSRAKQKFLSEIPNPYYGKQVAAMPGGKVMSNREFVYRPAYTMGRHIIGYEVQAVLALVDWFRKENGEAAVRVEGWGDGGMSAFYAGALDTRISETVAAGYFDRRDDLWQEPIDRNIFGLLREFGDAEIATLIAPRRFTVAAVPGPAETVTREKGEGGAPGRLAAPDPDSVAREVAKARGLVAPLGDADWIALQATGESRAPSTALNAVAGELAAEARGLPDAAAREARLIEGMNGFSQHLLAVSPAARRAFMSRLDFSSLEAYNRSAEWYRDYYREEIMGRIHAPKLPFNPRSRMVEETAAYVCHEVMLDVLPEFVLYGYLLIPKELKPGERRPVIVAQHGRGGTPRTLMALDRGGRQTYHGIAPRLAEKGYIVFAPQNPYVFEDRYRQLQRKANPLKLSLYSVIHAQYEQMLAWFKTLPQADPARIAFIGQSYGGKTAVRVPPVMPEFALAITTGDFNEGVTKMASTRYPFSFALWDEYEMFEFDLGNTFNYSDLAGLAAPRPFMAQRGHSDGVAWDEFVGYEYALVRQLYARLKIPDRTAIHWFDGGHEIAVDPAIAFFDRFLRARDDGD
jgi:cephalosporin-C deacetylase-like acetyl esterase